MNNYEKIIQEYSERYEFSVKDLIDSYEQGKTRYEMIQELKTTKYRVAEVLRLLHLRLTHSDGSLVSKQDRQKYLTDLKAEKEGCEAYREKIEELGNELEILYTELNKKDKALVKSRDTCNVLRKSIREHAREDSVWDIIERKMADFLMEADFKVEVPKLSKNIPDEGAALFWADQHVGVFVNGEECGNHYDAEEFKHRLNKTTDDFLSKGALSKNLRLNMIGDLLESMIHLDQLNNAELDIFQQMDMMIIEYLKQIKKILNVYESITIIGNVGNHARISKERTYANRYLNYETLLFKQLELALKVSGIERVELKQHISTHYLDTVNGVKVLTTHGDVFKAVSDSSVQNLIEYCKKIFGEEPMVIALGHFHRFEAKDVGLTEVMLVRSLKGTDQYFSSNLFKPNKAGTTWAFYADGGIKDMGNLKV